jgi:hypothetical protein
MNNNNQQMQQVSSTIIKTDPFIILCYGIIMMSGFVLYAINQLCSDDDNNDSLRILVATFASIAIKAVHQFSNRMIDENGEPLDRPRQSTQVDCIELNRIFNDCQFKRVFHVARSI